MVAGSPAIGSIPLFLGLAVAVPVLGHATWHLYRKVAAPAVTSGDRYRISTLLKADTPKAGEG
jgi:uncharacterized membrane protein